MLRTWLIAGSAVVLTFFAGIFIGSRLQSAADYREQHHYRPAWLTDERLKRWQKEGDAMMEQLLQLEEKQRKSSFRLGEDSPGKDAGR